MPETLCRRMSVKIVSEEWTRKVGFVKLKKFDISQDFSLYRYEISQEDSIFYIDYFERDPSSKEMKRRRECSIPLDDMQEVISALEELLNDEVL